MMRLAGAFTAEARAGGAEWRGWTVATLDYAAEAARRPRSARMGALLPALRAAPVGVLRKGQKLATFGGQPTAGRIEDWIASLRMGEIPWRAVDSADAAQPS